MKNWLITRRVFLKRSALFLTAPLIAARFQKPETMLRFGLVTDSHYADIDTAGTRYYRESIAKMVEFTELSNDQNADFVMHLGDFKNGAPDYNLDHLKKIESVYARFRGPRYHVLGNHDMDRISKDDFLSVIDNTGIAADQTYYFFDMGGVRVIVLDANFTADGTPYNSGNFHWTDANIPASQIQWLDEALSSAAGPVIICIHQLLDGDRGSVDVKNAAEVRTVLEQHQKVLAVFQGHHHSGQYNLINGIHYYTLKAMVEGSGEENNSYAIVEVFDDLSVTVTGYRKAADKKMAHS
jgi:predicted phosphodiesterase